MVKRSICLGILAVLSAAGAMEITFDKKMSGWVRSDRVNIVLDSTEKVSETGSLRLTSNPKKKHVNISKTIELEPDQEYEITLMVKGENISDKKTGIFFKSGKRHWDRLARWTGTFDWTKCTGTLKTGPAEDGPNKLSITLFGPDAKLWIDQLKISPKEKAESNQ